MTRLQANQSADQSGSARLNGINLGEINGRAAETCWQLIAVEKLALRGSDGAQGLSGHRAQSTVGRVGAAERTVVYRLLAVGGEGCGGGLLGSGKVGRKFVVWGGWVRAGRVVDRSWLAVSIGFAERACVAGTFGKTYLGLCACPRT